MTWGLHPLRVAYSQPGRSLPRLEGVLYLNNRGLVRSPPLNPFMPFVFYPTNTSKVDKLSAQWVAVTSLLAEDLATRGLVGRFSLPSGMLDGRSLQWKGFNVQIRYTYSDALPLDPSMRDAAVRKRIRKAMDAGYVAARSDDWAAIMHCLSETETEKGFSHHIGVESLRLAAELIGDDSFRGYVVRDPKGTVVSGGVRLHTENGVAYDWIQGTIREHLKYGVNQLIYAYVFEDLANAGAVGFDYGGANIPSVAAAKASWGLPLVPCLTIGAKDLRFIVRSGQSSGRWMMQRAKRVLLNQSR